MHQLVNLELIKSGPRKWFFLCIGTGPGCISSYVLHFDFTGGRVRIKIVISMYMQSILQPLSRLRCRFCFGYNTFTYLLTIYCLQFIRGGWAAYGNSYQSFIHTNLSYNLVCTENSWIFDLGRWDLCFSSRACANNDLLIIYRSQVIKCWLNAL